MSGNTSTDLRGLKLNVPRLWEHDWETAIHAATGAESFLLNVEGRAAHLLKFIDDPSLNFERLAWVNLWTKSFSILEGARAAVHQESQYLLEILSRTSFELQLHVLTASEADPVDRLRAYATWCLWNDRCFQKEFLDGRTLGGLWNPQPAKEIVNDPGARATYERLFGPLDIETDPKELRKGRFRQQNAEQFRLHRLESWLGHPDLRASRDRLASLTGGDEKKQVSFFALFNESERSVAQRLRSLEMRFLYLAYVKGSMFVHGSTLEHLFVMDEQSVTPRFTGARESVEDHAQFIGHACNTVLVQLRPMQTRLWPSASSGPTSPSRVKNNTTPNIRINTDPWQAGFACSPRAGYAGR
jgi:hypothetical protein